MARAINLNITESKQDLRLLLSQQSLDRNKDRIVSLYLLKIGKVKTLRELSPIVGRNPTTLHCWLQIYKNQGLEELLQTGS